LLLKTNLVVAAAVLTAAMLGAGDVVDGARAVLVKMFAIAGGTPAGAAASINDAVRVRCSANETLSSGGWSTITWDLEDYDTGGMHDTSSNTSRLVAPDTGVYLMTTFGLLVTDGGTGTRAFRFEKNGTTELAENSFPAASINIGVQSLSVVTKLTAGDYIEVGFFQDSGSNKTFDCTNAAVSPHATLTYLTGG